MGAWVGAWVEWPEGEVEEVVDGGDFWLLEDGTRPYLPTRQRCYCGELDEEEGI